MRLVPHVLIVEAVVVLLLGNSFSGCKRNPVGPSPNPLRDLTWSIDTLEYPNSGQTEMTSIYGVSANDVYAVGFNSSPGPGTMYHWNGIAWGTTSFHFAEGGPISGALSLAACFGLATNDFYFVGQEFWDNPKPPPNVVDSSLIVHFNGVSWQKVGTPDGRFLTCVYGISQNDIWAGGVNGTLLHFDGRVWSRDSVPMDIPPNADPVYVFTSIAGSPNGDAYLLLIARPDASDHDFLFKLTGGRWALVDSTYEVNRIWVSPSGTLYGVGTRLFKWQGPGKWNAVFNPTGFSLRKIFGTSDDELFVVGYDGYKGGLFHFNGTDWYEYHNLEFQNIVYADVWTDGKEVFVVGPTTSYPMVSIVLHGK